MIKSPWTAFFAAITPLILLFSLWVQKQWADKAASKAEAVKELLIATDQKKAIELDAIKKTTNQTHVLVNSQRGVILKNMALLSRNHAILARKQANMTNDVTDRDIADKAEAAALSAETDFSLHQTQQGIVDAG